MWTVKEVSRRTGVSIRTLHHYDSIGLLKPTETTQAGYRLYDGTALQRLQSILLFRALQFPLKEIKAILDSPVFDPREALEQQIHLLKLQRERIDRMIAFAQELQEKGVHDMTFQAFDTTELDQYTEEVKARWGNTRAYQEFTQKTQGKSSAERKANADQLMALLAEFGTLRSEAPAADVVQEKVKALKALISEHYYHCTNEILRGLGELYVSDDRMTRNIDAAGGDGTAAFVKEAIDLYCTQ